MQKQHQNLKKSLSQKKYFKIIIKVDLYAFILHGNAKSFIKFLTRRVESCVVIFLIYFLLW